MNLHAVKLPSHEGLKWRGAGGVRISVKSILKCIIKILSEKNKKRNQPFRAVSFRGREDFDVVSSFARIHLAIGGHGWVCQVPVVGKIAGS